MQVGIESINVYGGATSIDVRSIFETRNLDLERFNNLMMHRKSVALPCEDAVTDAVNAAKPLIDNLTQAEKNKIELVITGSESAIDVGKALSTYIHDYLGLNRNCRMFEVKQCCYSGTAALQTAASFVASNMSPGAKALVLASDSLPNVKHSYTEPSTGSGAVAMIVGDTPNVLELDFGACGYYGYEVLDFARPTPLIEYGNIDLTLMSYLDCCEKSFSAYQDRVEGADYLTTFDYLAFHTPFAGMVKGAHRKMLRQTHPELSAHQIEADFQKRVSASLAYCADVGNIAGGTVYMALCGIIDGTVLNDAKRVGLFSYGSGCSSEFFSGIITPRSKQELSKMNIRSQLDNRYGLSTTQYDHLLDLYKQWIIPTQNQVANIEDYRDIYNAALAGKGKLVLKQIKDYHREYSWS